MTMTPERLAELDAVMAKATAGEWGADGVRDNRIVWSGPDTRVCFMAIYPKAHADSLAIVALHNVYPDLRAHIEAQAATIAALQAFKDYVHERLDAAGIPTHPEGKHSAAGCRVGDRLDIALDAQAATIARLTEGLDKLAVELREYAGKWRDEGCDSQRVAHVAQALGNYADDVSTNRYGAQ